MTAGDAENQAAAQAMAAGRQASDKHVADALAQHRTTVGSDEAVEPASTPDAHAVPWFGTDNASGPGPSPQPSSSPNVDRPTDNSQSQP
jgi:hypothetical protein